MRTLRIRENKQLSIPEMTKNEVVSELRAELHEIDSGKYTKPPGAYAKSLKVRRKEIVAALNLMEGGS